MQKYVYSGSKSIKINQSRWGSLSFHYDKWSSGIYINTSLSRGIEFEIYSSSNIKLGVKLENDKKESFPLVEYKSIPINQWERVFITMEELNPRNNSINRINIGDVSGSQNTIFYLDDIKIISKSI